MCNSQRFSCEISPSQYQSDLLAPIRSYCTLLTLQNWLEPLTRYRLILPASSCWPWRNGCLICGLSAVRVIIARSCSLLFRLLEAAAWLSHRFLFPHISTTYITQEDFLQILAVSLSDSHLRSSLIWGIWSFLLPYSYLNGMLGEAISHGF